MVKVRGNILFDTKNYIKENYSKEEQDRFYSQMNPEALKVYEGVILSSEWYPLSVLQEKLRIQRVMFGDQEIIKSCESTTEKMTKGLFGLVLKFTTLDILLKRADANWKKAYDTGDLSYKIGDNSVIVTLHNFETTKEHLLCAQTVFGTLIDAVTKKKTHRSFKQIDSATSEFKFIF